MQGTFNRRDRRNAEILGVDADTMIHKVKTKQVKVVRPPAPVPEDDGEDDEDHDGDGSDTGQDGMPVPLPPVEENVTVIVYPPLQSFTLDSYHFLITDKHVDEYYREFDESGFWIVPYVREGNLGRPEAASEALPEALKSSDWGDNFNNMNPVPDRNFARLNVDFRAKTDETMQINFDFLKEVLDRAERYEYAFALRMQGLLNCSLNAVWTCTEFGFDNADRSYIMEQFLQKYIGRFLAQVSQKQEDVDPDRIVREALQMHSRFSAGWTKEHKKGLAPTLDSCSEALVGHFCEGPLKFLVDGGFNRKEIARFLRRDDRLSPQFALCLHFFMVKLEQDKNGRNANYKSMFNSSTSQLLQMRALDQFLRSNMSYMIEKYRSRLKERSDRRFDPLTMDWYYIVSQLHAPTVQYTGVKRTRTRMSRNAPGVFFASSTT